MEVLLLVTKNENDLESKLKCLPSWQQLLHSAVFPFLPQALLINVCAVHTNLPCHSRPSHLSSSRHYFITHLISSADPVTCPPSCSSFPIRWCCCDLDSPNPDLKRLVKSFLPCESSSTHIWRSDIALCHIQAANVIKCNSSLSQI